MPARTQPTSFDRAVDFYDETRSLSPDALRVTTDLLAHQLRGCDRVLEIGVGTGLLALPLAAQGFHVDGIDSRIRFSVYLMFGRDADQSDCSPVAAVPAAKETSRPMTLLGAV